MLITWMLSLSQVAVNTGIRIYGSQDQIIDQHTVIRVVGVDTKANYPIAISNVEYRWLAPPQPSIWAPLEFTERLAWQAECKAPSQPGVASWVGQSGAPNLGCRAAATATATVAVGVAQRS